MNNVINKLSELDTPNDPYPNKRFRFVSNTYNFNTTENVHDFCRRFNHDNNYIDNYGIRLCVGDNIVINDGRYNTTWLIAGFDCEHNRIASDGTTYDNGYGIFLVPETSIMRMPWINDLNKNIFGYLNSDIHKYINGPGCNSMKGILSEHLIERNVLLSNSICGYNLYSSDWYTWTKAYMTLISAGQVTSEYALTRYNNKYDDGEANYKLPLFDHIDFKVPCEWFWLRNIADSNCIYTIKPSGTISSENVYDNNGTVRPLIMIR